MQDAIRERSPFEAARNRALHDPDQAPHPLAHLVHRDPTTLAFIDRTELTQGEILSSGTAEDVRRELGRTERAISLVVIDRREEAAEWLEGQDGVHDLVVAENGITMGFKGDDRQQAALLTGLINQGLAVRSFEEKSASFEEILVDIAKSNREQNVN